MNGIGSTTAKEEKDSSQRGGYNITIRKVSNGWIISSDGYSGIDTIKVFRKMSNVLKEIENIERNNKVEKLKE